MSSTVDERTAWWERADLAHRSGRLHFCGRDVAELAAAHGTPSFLYSFPRIESKIQSLLDAAQEYGLLHRFRILYAMKANRFAALLTALGISEQVGIDACSPNEVEHAISCGFRPSDVSLTAHSLSPSDFLRLCRMPALHINFDSTSAIHSWGTLRPGSEIGIRINPGCGVNRANNEKLSYCGERTTKFGIYREQFDEALEVAQTHDLRVTTIHFHTGCGYLDDQLPALDRVLQSARWFINRVPTLEAINIGGGLGVPHVRSEKPLDLHAWAALIVKHFGSDRLRIQIEPGEFLVKDAGILLATVCYAETKRDQNFVGLNVGFNIAPEPVCYGLPFEPVPVVDNAQAEFISATIAGNINEAMDVWCESVDVRRQEVGDTLALLNAGAYSAAMASNHCMRGDFKEFLLR